MRRMALRNTFRSLAKTIITSFGDVAIESEYREVTGTTYNASTGAHTTTYTSYSSVPVIFNAFSFKEVDGVAVQPEDKTAYIAAEHIPDCSPEPDDLIISEEETWQVIRVNTDPASALWIIHVRRP